MKPSTDPIWNEWIAQFIYYSYSRKSLPAREAHINALALNRNDADKASAIIALSVAKWHPKNPYRGNGACFCCKYHNCVTTGCPALLVCGPRTDDNTLYHQWYVSSDAEQSDKLADKIYEILLTEYRKSLEKV
jgi:hypothetical protein